MIEDMLPMLTNEGFREHSHGHPGEIHIERF